MVRDGADDWDEEDREEAEEGSAVRGRRVCFDRLVHACGGSYRLGWIADGRAMNASGKNQSVVERVVCTRGAVILYGL